MQVSSLSKLLSMRCVILSFQIGFHLLAVAFSKSLRFLSGAEKGIIEMTKSAFNHWSSHGFKFSLSIRVSNGIQSAQMRAVSLPGVSYLESCFSQASVLVNPYRSGIALISGTSL